jgi:deoxyribodipyrimidine photo-lyase
LKFCKKAETLFNHVCLFAMKKFKISIHIFRRDLRLHDNTALLAALEQSEYVIPVFIFDYRQLSNSFRGNNSFEFMINSLFELNSELKKKGSQIYFFSGIPHEVINEIFLNIKIDALFLNRDYTPFSRSRDKAIDEICEQNGVIFSSYSDALLTEPGLVMKNDNTPYTIFTPFYNAAKLFNLTRPTQNNYLNYYTGSLEVASRIELSNNFLGYHNPDLLIKGGREEGLKLLGRIIKPLQSEGKNNYSGYEGSSMLSAHHKFGTVSVRETYHKIDNHFGKDHHLIRELYWRDFLTHIAFHFPHVFGKPFHLKYENVYWENDEEKFEAWCSGRTGFPIVDAGMRELVKTGFINNRIRMIVASFLVKDLHIDWRWGERFFAYHLVDYDPALNNGNWQWAASTGCDAQPYFRIFNPWSQQRIFDPECRYIKKWVKELSGFSSSEIHNIGLKPISSFIYPRPIVDHKIEGIVSKEIFMKLK